MLSALFAAIMADLAHNTSIKLAPEQVRVKAPSRITLELRDGSFAPIIAKANHNGSSKLASD